MFAEDIIERKRRYRIHPLSYILYRLRYSKMNTTHVLRRNADDNGNTTTARSNRTTGTMTTGSIVIPTKIMHIEYESFQIMRGLSSRSLVFAAAPPATKKNKKMTTTTEEDHEDEQEQGNGDNEAVVTGDYYYSCASCPEQSLR